MTITNRQICWICQKFRFINLQLTNTIYKRQTTNDNCHSDQIQGVFEMRAQILTTSYWLHVELGKNI
jgi:hypothetical protein